MIWAQTRLKTMFSGLKGTMNEKKEMQSNNFAKLQQLWSKKDSISPSIKSKKEIKIYVVKYDFDGANNDRRCLSIKKGQRIEFIEDSEFKEDGWASGKLLDNGLIGLYPTNYVEVCSVLIPLRGLL